MKKIASLKAQATNLKAALAALGLNLTHTQALETIAQQYGQPNWDTLAGMVNKVDAVASAAEPTLADLLCSEGRPAFAVVELPEPSMVSRDCNVELFEDLLEYVHDEGRLKEELARHAELYPDGVETIALVLQADGDDFVYTLDDLIGIRYREVGDQGHWLLKDGTYLRFGHSTVWTAAKAASPATTTSALSVPELLKSTKGCQLVFVDSDTDDEAIRHVVVPPHLSVQAIAAKVDAEIVRLRQMGEDGVKEADLAAFVHGLGCGWVERAAWTDEVWS